MKLFIPLIIILSIHYSHVNAQDSTIERLQLQKQRVTQILTLAQDSIAGRLPKKYLLQLQHKSHHIEEQVNERSEKALEVGLNKNRMLWLVENGRLSVYHLEKIWLIQEVRRLPRDMDMKNPKFKI
ncbi:hypothetical protein SAMN05518672_103436 [Chitinophaga sp. CF118]|nr:hypothetical protein [Chitinophaga sp. CF118]SFD83681.1 hypothetical protein SAMN05518672_103436 [Chitinophaga sp. CF118]